MKQTILGALALAGFLAAAPAARADLVSNGSFDLAVPSNGSGGGWTASNNDFNGGWRSSGGNPGAMFILNDAGQAASDPTIQQLVSGLTPLSTYRLSGNFANVYNCCGSLGLDTFAIDIDGVNLAELDYPGNGVWGAFSFDIVADDSDLLLAFRAEIHSDDTEYKIDNISLVEVNQVPEPASLLLVGLGVAGIGIGRRRKSPAAG